MTKALKQAKHTQKDTTSGRPGNSGRIGLPPAVTGVTNASRMASRASPFCRLRQASEQSTDAAMVELGHLRMDADRRGDAKDSFFSSSSNRLPVPPCPPPECRQGSRLPAPFPRVCGLAAWAVIA